MTFTILIIEDDPKTVEHLKLTFGQRLPDALVESVDFPDALGRVTTLRPDAVVMDVLEDADNTRTTAEATLDYLWDVHFCPVVVHSAHDEPEFFKGKHHPFTHFEAKTDGSDERVAAKLKAFCNHMDCLRKFAAEVAKRTSESLRHVTALIWNETGDENEQRDMLLRVARRRIAASFDLAPAGDKHPRAWEQYIYPPLDPDLLTGDVLHATDGKADDPTSFRVVLSPSCDLVVNQSGALKEVLIARCVGAEKWLKKVKLDANTPEDKLRDRLPKEVTRDQHEGIKILPSLPGHIPIMAVDLKNLELIPFDKIRPPGGALPAFVRIASVDSPFREQLAWAYVQVAGRPGMPVTDVLDFSERIIRAVKPAKPA